MKEFYDTKDFPFVKEVENNWEKIYTECKNIQPWMINWPLNAQDNTNWNVFGLYSWPDGKAVDLHCKACPFTAQLINSVVPNHRTASFSKLKANSVIKPHTGYNGDVLRMHLGLYIPEGDCAIKVGNSTFNWQNGKALVFDDRLMHETWNNTNEDRLVFIIDFVPDFKLESL